ncbi:pseudouridine synthase [Priestia megaterium]
MNRKQTNKPRYSSFIRTRPKTLLNAVAAYFQKIGLKTKPRHVHRLDSDTSGAILFTKHFVASSVFDQLLAERKINRTYIAIVQGIIKKRTESSMNPLDAIVITLQEEEYLERDKLPKHVIGC